MRIKCIIVKNPVAKMSLLNDKLFQVFPFHIRVFLLIKRVDEGFFESKQAYKTKN